MIFLIGQGVKGDFLVQVEERFAYIFGIYIKFRYMNPSILTPYKSVNIAS